MKHKRALALLLAAALCCALLAGCAAPAGGEDGSGGSGGTSGSQEGPGEGIPFEEGQLYAVAYLGYQEMGALEEYAQRYLDGGRLPVHYLSPGDFYLVIPRYAGMELALYRNDVETGAAELIYEDPDCGPFVLQCNVSDIFADATIRLDYQGETAEFSPFISLKDGSVDAGARGLLLTGEEDGG